MRDSAVIIAGLLLIGGCGRVYVNPARNAGEQKQDLADCTAKAEHLSLAFRTGRVLRVGVAKRLMAMFVEDCMAARGYQSQMVLK
jgi:hypothetical protein